MSLRKTIAWFLITLAALGVALIFASCVPDIITNDRHLHQMEKRLLAIPPAPQSKQLAVRSAVGLLSGNGNHCDFFAGASFQSTATPDSIRQHYLGRSFLNPTLYRMPKEIFEWQEGF